MTRIIRRNDISNKGYYLARLNHIRCLDTHARHALANEYAILYQSERDLEEELAVQLPEEYWRSKGIFESDYDPEWFFEADYIE